VIVDVIVPIGLVIALLLGYDHGLAPATDTRVAPALEEPRTAIPPSSTPSPTARAGSQSAKGAARVVRGIASTYGPGFAGFLALPEGPGIRVRVCGPASCVERTSNDAGPSLKMQRAGRIVDLDVATFEAVSGASWRKGLVRVTVEYLE
jgi:hypothetical protein